MFEQISIFEKVRKNQALDFFSLGYSNNRHFVLKILSIPEQKLRIEANAIYFQNIPLFTNLTSKICCGYDSFQYHNSIFYNFLLTQFNIEISF
jgi:hypothetical protein